LATAIRAKRGKLCREKGGGEAEGRKRRMREKRGKLCRSHEAWDGGTLPYFILFSQRDATSLFFSSSLSHPIP
jgi:hypothetical protein